jgi:hypothetical protein
MSGNHRPIQAAARRHLREGGCRQIRSRVFQAKKTKAATSAIMISIQFWPSKPAKVKCLMRNCTAPALNFGQNKRFICAG